MNSHPEKLVGGTKVDPVPHEGLLFAPHTCWSSLAKKLQTKTLFLGVQAITVEPSDFP